MTTITNPDDNPWLQVARAAAKFVNDNRAAIEQAARAAEQMRPYLQAAAPAIQSMQADMNLAAILARQHAAFTAMRPALPVPTPQELYEAELRVTELLPETDEEREQVAEQAAEIQADPEGKQLIDKLTDWASQIVNLLKDVPNGYKAAVSMVLVAWAVWLLPPADAVKVGLFCAAAAVLLMIFPPSGQ